MRSPVPGGGSLAAGASRLVAGMLGPVANKSRGGAARRSAMPIHHYRVGWNQTTQLARPPQSVRLLDTVMGHHMPQSVNPLEPGLPAKTVSDKGFDILATLTVKAQLRVA